MNQTNGWVTIELLKDILEKNIKEDVQISKYVVTPAIPIGENYTSDLIKINVNYVASKKCQNICIIAKCCSSDELLINYCNDMKLFVQEIGFYNEIVPDMSRLDYVEKMCANALYISQQNSIIMLEDLTSLGFKMYPREIGLDLKHTLLVTEKIAYLHASSVAIYQKNPSLMTKYDLGIYWNNPFTVKWITVGFKALIEACTEWPYLNKYVNKLKSTQNHILKTGFEITKPTGALNVLNHGDPWTNNFMFSYDINNEVKNTVFVDFQVILFSSPALDLNYLWATSPNPNVLSQHLDAVLNCYCDKFIDVLEKLHISTRLLNQKQLKEEFKSKAFYGLMALVTVCPFVTSDRRSDASFDQLFNNDSKEGFRYHCFNNERYREKLVHLLELYDNLGILDQQC